MENANSHDLSRIYRKHPLIAQSILRLETSDITIIFVEGATDYRFYYSILKRKKLTILACDGRDNVCKLVNNFYKDYPKQVYGICDRDLLTFGIGTHEGKNILHTDFHDLEMDALNHADLNTFLSFVVKEKAVKNPSDVLNFALHLAKPIGYLRLINEKSEHGIDFKGSKPEKNPIQIFQQKKTKSDLYNSNYQPSLKGLIEKLFNRAENKDHRQKLDAILQEVQAEMTNDYDTHQICNGHDFIAALHAVLKDSGRKGDDVPRTEAQLHTQFLQNYHHDYFLRSNLGQQLVQLGLC